MVTLWPVLWPPMAGLAEPREGLVPYSTRDVDGLSVSQVIVACAGCAEAVTFVMTGASSEPAPAAPKR